jgi:hypothetical protein
MREGCGEKYMKDIDMKRVKLWGVTGSLFNYLVPILQDKLARELSRTGLDGCLLCCLEVLALPISAC